MPLDISLGKSVRESEMSDEFLAFEEDIHDFLFCKYKNALKKYHNFYRLNDYYTYGVEYKFQNVLVLKRELEDILKMDFDSDKSEKVKQFIEKFIEKTDEAIASSLNIYCVGD